jgi:hypothetical protein
VVGVGIAAAKGWREEVVMNSLFPRMGLSLLCSAAAAVVVACGGADPAEDIGNATAAETASCGTPPDSNAIAGGRDNGGPNGPVLWYCVGYHTDRSVQPGKYVPHDRKCHYAWGGKEWATTNFSFIEAADVSPNERALIVTPGEVPGAKSCGAYAPQTGTDSNGRALYSCSAVVFDSSGNQLSENVQPGKLLYGSGGTATCHVAFGGKEYAMSLNGGGGPQQTEALYFYNKNQNCGRWGWDNLCPTW